MAVMSDVFGGQVSNDKVHIECTLKSDAVKHDPSHNFFMILVFVFKKSDQCSRCKTKQ